MTTDTKTVNTLWSIARALHRTDGRDYRWTCIFCGAWREAPHGKGCIVEVAHELMAAKQGEE